MTDTDKILVELGKIQVNQANFKEAHERNANNIEKMDEKLDQVLPKVARHDLAIRIGGWVCGTLFTALIGWIVVVL